MSARASSDHRTPNWENCEQIVLFLHQFLHRSANSASLTSASLSDGKQRFLSPAYLLVAINVAHPEQLTSSSSLFLSISLTMGVLKQSPPLSATVPVGKSSFFPSVGAGIGLVVGGLGMFSRPTQTITSSFLYNQTITLLTLRSASFIPKGRLRPCLHTPRLDSRDRSWRIKIQMQCTNTRKKRRADIFRLDSSANGCELFHLL